MKGWRRWVAGQKPGAQNHPYSISGLASSPHRRLVKGFTLIEILVALTIFAIMALAAFRGLSAMLDARAHIEQENDKWRGVALFFARLENDLEAVLNRPIRDASDLVLPALSGNTVIYGEDGAQLAFTRNGYAGQDGNLSAPQRVGYRLRGETLEVMAWSAPDLAPRSRPEISGGLKGVTQFGLRYLDRSGNWQTQWPLPGQASLEQGLPAAVEASIALRSGESVSRIFALP